MKKHNLHVHILPVLVQEVLEEVRDGLVGDVAAHHHVPEDRGGEEKETRWSRACFRLL